MDEKRLEWEVLDSETILHTRVFDVKSSRRRSATGVTGDYLTIDTSDWVLTIPVIDGDLILVRQWRHGSEALTLEFPGGVTDPGETPEQAGLRELEEETGFRAGRIRVLGRCRPNPAIMSNYITFCLAEDLVQTGQQHLDRDEVLEWVRVPFGEALEAFCSGEYENAFMGTGFSLYMRHLMREGKLEL